MTDFQTIKVEFSLAVDRALTDRANSAERSLLDDWVSTLSAVDVATLKCSSFDPREIDNWFNDNEVVFSKTFHLCNESDLRQCCSPGPHCRAGSHCIPIGGVDGGDEFLFVTDTPSFKIAVLHHDDVYLANELDAVVLEKSERLNVPITRFLELLRPETCFAKFMASNDASKWLVVEQIGQSVRYEFNLSPDWDDGEQQFQSVDESEAFFFDMIKKGCATTGLSILSCSPQIREQIETILKSPAQNDT